MCGSPLLFNQSGIDIPISENDVKKILKLIIHHHNARFELLEIAIVNEEEIVRINKKFLGKDYITDTISFRYEENSSNNKIEATIYVCAQRVKEQALELGKIQKDEFLRIIIHGLLHVIGFDDKTKTGKQEMSDLEDKYLKNFYQR